MDEIIAATKTQEALGLSRPRCTAKAKTTGEQCNRRAILGGFVCPMHGGATPVVKEAAKNRLMEIADPAVYALRMVVVDLSEQWERAVALEDASRIAHFTMLGPQLIRAATVVLDRCGLSPQMKLEVSTPNEFANMSLAEIADRAEAFAREARASADEEARLIGGVVDGEVVGR